MHTDTQSVLLHKKKTMEDDLPSFLCPISQMTMKDPVMLETGHSYDRKSIQQWFSSGKNTDPVTNLSLKRKHDMISNYALKNAILESKEKETRLMKWEIAKACVLNFLLNIFTSLLSKKLDLVDASFIRNSFLTYKFVSGGNTNVIANVFEKLCVKIITWNQDDVYLYRRELLSFFPEQEEVVDLIILFIHDDFFIDESSFRKQNIFIHLTHVVEFTHKILKEWFENEQVMNIA